MRNLGVDKVRFTGGEPTVYRHLIEIIRYSRSLDCDLHIALTTNGHLLERMAGPMAEAGLDSVNISLDTLDREKFQSIAGVDSLDRVIEGIDCAVRHIPTVKLNCVIMDGLNDCEAADMVTFADEKKIDLRFIEYMPTKHNSEKARGFVCGDDIRKRLPWTLSPIESDRPAAARYYGSPELGIRVGFINPVSHPFCGECNRVRLASDGRLYGCLFSGDSINLFDLLAKNSGAAETAIERLVQSKLYRGCTAGADGEYPSFVTMGG